MMKRYKVLYTHQKAKKSKVWQDGVLSEVNNTKLCLSGTNGRFIESVFTLTENISVGDEIESDGHLILIDALEIDKENCPPNSAPSSAPSVPSAPSKLCDPRSSSTYKPRFLSKKLTSPLLSAPAPISYPPSTQQTVTGLQSQKVVRKPQSLMTSISESCQSPVVPQIRQLAVNHRELSGSRVPNSANRSDESYLDLSSSLTVPKRDFADLTKFLESPATPKFPEASPNLIVEPPTVPLATRLDCRDYQTICDVTPCIASGKSEVGSPKKVRSMDSIFRALDGDCASQLCVSFDLIDESLFSPESPKIGNIRDQSPISIKTGTPVALENSSTQGSSSLSNRTQEQVYSGSIPSSLDRMIDDKIDAVPSPIPPDKICEKEHCAMFETVDYSDMFGDDDVPVGESFDVNVIELSTQGDRVIEEGNVTDAHAENVSEARVPFEGKTFSDWDFGESFFEDEPGIVAKERTNKRKKCESPRVYGDDAVEESAKQRKKGFKVPFASGTDQQFREIKVFHSNEIKFSSEPLKRSYTIPLEYSSAAHYKKTLLDVIYEHLNVSLAKVCEKYSRMCPTNTPRNHNTTVVRCVHGPAKLCTVSKDGPNKGRQFYSCVKKSCDLFKWSEQSNIPQDPQKAFDVLTRAGLSFYKDCHLKRKSNSNLYLLQLSVLDKHVNYNKDDIWIIDPDNPCVMISTFYGPSSSGCVELRQVSGRHSGGVVTAIHALKSVSELDIIGTIEEKLASLPILPCLLTRQLNQVDGVTVKLVTNVDEICTAMCREYQLNEKQEETVMSFIHSLNNGPAVLCVQGVFGSGKSYLLAVLILILVRVMDGSHNKILVTSTTNVAVDNILNKLLDLGFEHFARLGSVKRIHKRIVPYVVQNQELVSHGPLPKQDQTRGILDRYQVVGTTCASSPGVSEHDIVLFDEVSQVTEPSSLLPLINARCKHLLLVGDPKQLPPTVETQHVSGTGAPGLEQTLFDRLVRLGYPTIFLNTQYRCPPAISSIVNTLFYSGELRDGNVRVSGAKESGGVDKESYGVAKEIGDVAKEINDDANESEVSSILPIPAVTFISVSGTETSYGDSYSNATEVKAISEVLAAVTSERNISKEDIAVITLYRGQESLLKRELPGSKSLKISTVDAVQGAEKPIIILSCVRSTRIGFADCPRRINVALTRAKEHLIIFGNIQMLSTNQLWGTIIQICADRGVVWTLDDVIHKIRSRDQQDLVT